MKLRETLNFITHLLFAVLSNEIYTDEDDELTNRWQSSASEELARFIDLSQSPVVNFAYYLVNMVSMFPYFSVSRLLTLLSRSTNTSLIYSLCP